jgi:hypothetical protein
MRFAIVLLVLCSFLVAGCQNGNSQTNQTMMVERAWLDAAQDLFNCYRYGNPKHRRICTDHHYQELIAFTRKMHKMAESVELCLFPRERARINIENLLEDLDRGASFNYMDYTDALDAWSPFSECIKKG